MVFFTTRYSTSLSRILWRRSVIVFTPSPVKSVATVMVHEENFPLSSSTMSTFFCVGMGSTLNKIPRAVGAGNVSDSPDHPFAYYVRGGDDRLKTAIPRRLGGRITINPDSLGDPLSQVSCYSVLGFTLLSIRSCVNGLIGPDFMAPFSVP